ncbi:NAD(P)-dependent alcohol dehydrogenase [Gordonia rhizosphera]|uniref:Aryl-alcohol dehydrogenase AdhA n=1 Tax=Gordonia rhizosphera NBRC 16068 TaxID=1108045 RepID=K6WWC8_9ACTN|nr:NAD(P)-dependent alcohol dehydrogenase [Gordonia rhizosphera]GAB90834.1 aryl-alcohol dehydrogenase AdhA [Gordonia rhizosphera NBRC 16068]
MHIHAAVLRDSSAPLRIETLELRAPGRGEVLVEIAATGVCHTDMLPRRAGFLAQPPIVLGHEGAGVVTAVGDDVTGVQVGDHVLISYASCGECRTCLAGEPFNCFRFFALNMTGRDADSDGPMTDEAGHPVASSWFGQSSFATHTVVSAANVVRVAKDLPLQLLAPMGCGFQTGAGAVLRALRASAGSTIAVIGVGAVGLAAVMAARAADCAEIIAVDRNEKRLAVAEKLGATMVFDSSAVAFDKAIRSTVRGGVDAIIDTTGSAAVIEAAIGAVRPGGRVGMVGTVDRDLAIPAGALGPSKTLLGIIEGGAVPGEFIPELVTLWRDGNFPIDDLITTYPLSEINRAEADLRAGTVVKPVILPNVI